MYSANQINLKLEAKTLSSKKLIHLNSNQAEKKKYHQISPNKMDL